MSSKSPNKLKSRDVEVLDKKTVKKKLRKTSSNGHPSHTDLTIDHLDSKELLRVLIEVKNGNFSVRMPTDEAGLNGKVYDTLNEIISLNERMMLEFTRAGNTIGKKGKLTQRIEIPSSRGSWKEGVES